MSFAYVSRSLARAQGARRSRQEESDNNQLRQLSRSVACPFAFAAFEVGQQQILRSLPISYSPPFRQHHVPLPIVPPT